MFVFFLRFPLDRSQLCINKIYGLLAQSVKPYEETEKPLNSNQLSSLTWKIYGYENLQAINVIY